MHMDFMDWFMDVLDWLSEFDVLEWLTDVINTLMEWL